MSFIVILFVSVFSRGWMGSLTIFSDISFVLSLIVSLTFFICLFSNPLSNILTSITCLFSLLFFLTDSQINLYIMFEAAIFPVVIILLIIGNTFERFEAAYFLIFFRAMRSYPAFLRLWIDYAGTLSLNIFSSSFWRILFIFAFLVKIPVYFFHYWLPKAHVEAPTVGSMILAGILLKLGGWGLIRILNFFISSWFFIIVFFILGLGAILAPFWAITHRDGKGLVAFSSISHINFSGLIVFMSVSIRKTACVFVFLTHDIISCIMFWTVGTLYHITHSRQIVFLSNISQMSMILRIIILVFFLSNFRVPPFISFFHEFIFIRIFFSVYLCFRLLVILYVILVSYFTLYLIINFFIYKNSVNNAVFSINEMMILVPCFLLLLILPITQTIA